jgi:hypothetical protein
MGEWLIADISLFGVLNQTWMLVVSAIVLFGFLYVWRQQRCVPARVFANLKGELLRRLFSLAPRQRGMLQPLPQYPYPYWGAVHTVSDRRSLIRTSACLA